MAKRKEYYFVGFMDRVASCGFDAWHFGNIIHYEHSECYEKSYKKAKEELEEAKSYFAQRNMFGRLGIFQFIEVSDNKECYEERLKDIDDKIIELNRERDRILNLMKEG